MAEETNRLTLDADSFADVIKTILKNFLKMMLNIARSSERSGCLVIDIELIAKGDFYTVQMTHCGRWTEQGIENLVREFCLMDKNGILPNNKVIANVFERVNGEDEETTYKIKGGQSLAGRKTDAKNRLIHFPSFKNYVLIKLKYRLLSKDLMELREILLQEFNETEKSHREVKITFYSKNEVFYSNHVGSDDDFKHCEILSLSLISVIKQSMNNQFKERCLQTLKAHSVHDAQSTLTGSLFSVTHENYIIP